MEKLINYNNAVSLIVGIIVILTLLWSTSSWKTSVDYRLDAIDAKLETTATQNDLDQINEKLNEIVVTHEDLAKYDNQIDNRFDTIEKNQQLILASNENLQETQNTIVGALIERNSNDQ